MTNKQKEVLDVALDKLKEELERGLMSSPERIGALAHTIKVLLNVDSLTERLAALERQLAGQPIAVNIDLPSNTVGDLNKVLNREIGNSLIEGPNEPLKQTQDDTPDSYVMAEGNYPIQPGTISNLEQITIETGKVPNSQCIASKGCDLDER